jgi:copper(I)-binding protein
MMRKLLIVASAMLVLAGCNSRTETSKTVVSDGQTSATTQVKTNDNGVHSGLKFTQYAVRAALGVNPNTAAYVTIENTGQTPDRLVSASCACAKTAALHTMSMNGTMMEMGDAKNGFAIAPGQTIALKPGGDHIMLMGLTGHPQDGDFVDVTLNFEKAGAITLHMPVSTTPLASDGQASDSAMSGMKM